MDTLAIITELEAQKANIDEVIAAMRRMAGSGVTGKRRGRPPVWLQQAKQAKTSTAAVAAVSAPAVTVKGNRGGKRAFSVAARRNMATAQRLRWAAKRKALKSAKRVKAAAKTAKA